MCIFISSNKSLEVKLVKHTCPINVFLQYVFLTHQAYSRSTNSFKDFQFKMCLSGI